MSKITNAIIIVFIISGTHTQSLAQQIIDSCFLSVKTLGEYTGSSDLVNVCHCSNYYEASDLMEWNEVTESWDGKLPNNSTVDLLPPHGGCLSRAIWIGSPGWTPDGEAFALRLNKTTRTR